MVPRNFYRSLLDLIDRRDIRLGDTNYQGGHMGRNEHNQRRQS